LIVALGTKGVGDGTGVGDWVGVFEGDGEAVALGGIWVRDGVCGSSVAGVAQADREKAMAMNQNLVTMAPWGSVR
jgi:hypothetical protein